MAEIIFETDMPELTFVKRGKVRDIYDLGDSLLMVASDRLSAFDVVLPNPIPDKGKVLNGISLFWFGKMADIIPNHIISSDVETFPEVCRPYAHLLDGRSVVVRKAEPLPVECIVRGYISGSGWNDYRKTGSVCGIPLPVGLKESEQLPEPIFTPSTKADAGEHDVNIDFHTAAGLLGGKLAGKIRDLSIAIYKRGTELAADKGIIIADTKFEFGKIGDEIVLIDEVMTPDSSRFWPKDTYAPGGAQKSFDKQYVRDYLIDINWNRKPPAPELPEAVIEKTRSKYMEALKRLTA